MLGKFFDTKPVDGFVDLVVNDVVRLLPPDQLARASSAKRREPLEVRMLERVETFRRDARPGFFQKARLGTRLQDALIARGYPAEFSREFAYTIATRLASAAIWPVEK